MSNPSAARPVSIPLEANVSTEVEREFLTLGWYCTFLSVISLLLITAIGSAGAAGFILIWAAYSAIRPDCVVRSLPLLGMLWAFPVLCLVSTVWSEGTMMTARFSVQYALTVLFAVIAAQATPPRQFISAIMSATVIIAVLSLLSGRFETDPMSGTVTFLGIFASKNYLAFFLSLMFLAATAVLIDRRQPLMFRAISVIAFFGASPLIVLTRSATSIVVSVACIGVLTGAFLFSKMEPKWRALTVIVALVAAAYVGAVLAGNAEIFELFITRVLGKDATLTGRTFLWGKALELISLEPLLGRGFNAFWRHDSLEAEALWRLFHIPNRGGFHFHNTYLEILVGLGYLGFVIFVATLLVILGRLLLWFMETLSIPSAFFLTVFSSILIRSFVEVDVIYQFQIGTVLLYAMAVYGKQRHPHER